MILYTKICKKYEHLGLYEVILIFVYSFENDVNRIKL